MRSVSFMDFVEFALEGNVMSRALTLADVNNDGNKELVVGTTSGDLSIFKGIENTKPWLRASNLGMIVCVGVGDLCNDGVNCLYCLTTEGWCYIFNISAELQRHQNDETLKQWENLSNTTTGANKTYPTLANNLHAHTYTNNIQTHTYTYNQAHKQPLTIEPTYAQKLSSNCKACVVVDIDRDGSNELAVAYSDRVVRSFKWLPNPPPPSSLHHHPPASSPAPHPHSFVLVEKWKLAGQIGSMTVKTGADGAFEVLVSQPGGSYVVLLCSPSPASEGSQEYSCKYNYNHNNYVYTNEEEEEDERREAGVVVSEGVAESETSPHCRGASICYHPLGSARARNRNVTTEIISDIVRAACLPGQAGGGRGGGAEDAEEDAADEGTEDGQGGRTDNRAMEGCHYSAICTLDGTLTLIDDDKILWSLYIDHQLFSLNKMDFTDDGTEEVVVCSWDGYTYFVNLAKQVLRFNFRQNVAAFCAGKFTLKEGSVSNCLCYATFIGKLVVYYNLDLHSVAIRSVVVDAAVLDAIARLRVDVDNPEDRQTFLRQLLYHPQKFIEKGKKGKSNVPKHVENNAKAEAKKGANRKEDGDEKKRSPVKEDDDERKRHPIRFNVGNYT